MKSVWLVCALAACLGPALAYEKGAPEGTCESMKPEHGVDAQTSASPYKLDAVKANDGSVALTLSGSKTFKGFFVQGRNAAGKPVGAFKTSPNAHTVPCSGPGSASGITHTGPEDKSSIALTWEPKGATGPITFLYTVVHNGGEFWVRQAVTVN